MYQIYFDREKKQIEVAEGTTILEAQRLAGLRPDAPCGGAGTCGKCQVMVKGQILRACQTKIQEDLHVGTTGTLSLEKAVVQTEGLYRPVCILYT